jgi:hypothetical protein
MVKNIKIKAGDLKGGEKVYVQGFIFEVVKPRFFTTTEGLEVVRFKGICTNNEINDSIRKTLYNGGTYGMRVDLDYFLSE